HCGDLHSSCTWWFKEVFIASGNRDSQEMVTSAPARSFSSMDKYLLLPGEGQKRGSQPVTGRNRVSKMDMLILRKGTDPR
ncbi:hypothetical protein STEG23_010209, partial [Scotinomys teguina]